jgi:DNA-binding NarL/FixJ family response regulator
VGRIESPTFVGRAAELTALEDALDRAAAGEMTTVLIAGDPGIGKTRLLQAWNARAARRGARIALGSCLDLGEAGPAYTAIVEALRDLLLRLDPGEEERLVGADRSVLGRILPELSPRSDSVEPDYAASGFAQTKLFDRLVDVIHRAGTVSPVVLELEDIHWADRSSQAFLLYLVEVAREANLLVIGTYRPEAADTDQAFRTTLSQLLRRPRVATLPVAPFDEAELREQLTGILGEAPTTSLLAAIRERSEGNPLFVEELATATDPSAHLPASIAAATATKVETLSDEARAVLRVASVVGRSAPYAVLRDASGLGDETLARALREAVRAGLLEPHHVGEAYRFRHALLQDAIYQETLPGERRRLHAAVARALTGDPSHQPDDPDLAPRLARHWFEAGDVDRALLAALAAAASAERQSAYAEAATQFERALELWDRAPNASPRQAKSDVLERAAWAAFLAGGYDRAVTLAQATVDELGPAADRSRLIRVLDLLSWSAGRAGIDSPDSVRAIAAMDPDGLRPEDRVMVLSYRAVLHDELGELREALEVARPLVEEARAAGNFRVLAQAGMVLAGVLQYTDPAGALDVLEPIRREAAEVGDDVYRTDLEVAAGRIMLDAGMHDELLAALPDALELATRTGLGRWARPQLRYAFAHALLLRGELAESLEQVQLARLDTPTGRIRALLEIVGALAATATGAFEEAADHLEASRLPNSTPEAELGRGWLAAARARLALSERRYEDVAAIVGATAPRVLEEGVYTPMTDTMWWMAEPALAALAEQAEHTRAAGAADGAIAESTAKIEGWLEETRRLLVASALPQLEWRVGYEALIAGHLARIRGHDEPSIWAEAAGHFPDRSVEALAARYRQAEALLATRGSRDAVREIMVGAHAIATETGARPLTGQFDALARRARIELRAATSKPVALAEDPPGNEPALPVGHAALRGRGLSDREIEVLTLVAAGYSNGQIGERLFISTKTASVHVSHIMDKLGVSSRTEAATIGVRLGLPEAT